uniref:Uncharacterized protein LOC104265524 n=1 Tax=Phallusia mammillata TaxID=59560 RepID=A0A6F9DJJ0_9ASCI|nr:uncharacterized protein LOC104265524 [Phallusia mammillata]
MARMCCIPFCDKKAPDVSLFRVKSKSMCSKNDQNWAEQMEKIILLSGSVAKLMKSRGGTKMMRRAWFADLFNKWFDLMNTRTNPGYNPDLQPYRSLEDPRLNWLSDTFLKELIQWKNCLTGTASEQAKQFLSNST